MKLSLNLIWIGEVASVHLDLPEQEKSPVETVVEKAIGTTTKWWLSRLFR